MGGEAKRAEFTNVALPLMDNVYSAALYLSRDPDEASDLVQETFLRAYRAWHQFTPGTNCKAWLLTILHNTFRNRYRAQQRRPQTVELDETQHSDASSAEVQGIGTDPAALVSSQVLDGDVDAALRRLPDDFLQVVLLIDIEELTYEEAATAIGCPVGTVRSRLSRGRRLLHQSLEQYAKERGLLRRRG
jgi:RNA polymerase sigma-70 factor (ECF subfamily)